MPDNNNYWALLPACPSNQVNRNSFASQYQTSAMQGYRLDNDSMVKCTGRISPNVSIQV